MTTTVLTIQEVATRFDELAQQEKWFEIQEELFAQNVRSVDPPHFTFLLANSIPSTGRPADMFS